MIALDKKTDADEKRKKLLERIAKVSAAVAALILATRPTIIGMILRMSHANGTIPSYAMPQFIPAIENLLRHAQLQSESLVAGHYGQFIADAVDLVDGNGSDIPRAETAFDEALALGPRGVGINASLESIFDQAAKNILSEVQRAIISQATVKEIEMPVSLEIERKLKDRVESEIFQQISFAWMRAAKSVGKQSTEVLGYIWRLSPIVDNHCRICVGRDGNEYDKDDPILNELSAVHLHCACWGEPVFE